MQSISTRLVPIFLTLLVVLTACSRSSGPSLEPAAANDAPTDVTFLLPGTRDDAQYFRLELVRTADTVAAKVDFQSQSQNLEGIKSASLNLADDFATSNVSRITGDPSVVVRDVLPGRYQVTAFAYSEEGGAALYNAVETVTVVANKVPQSNPNVSAKGAAQPTFDPNVNTHRLSLRRLTLDDPGTSLLAALVGDENGISIDFSKTSDWDAGRGIRGFTANLTIRNNTVQTLDPWDLAFDLPADISQMWNASYTRDGERYTITPANWNQTLRPNSSVSFGFQGSYAGIVDSPTAYLINGQSLGEIAPEPEPEPDVTIRYEVQSQWQNGNGSKGVVANVYIKNNGERPLDWKLEYDYGATITNMWNARYTQEGTTYVVTPEGWNTRLNPGQERTFGFEARFEGDLSEPFNYLVNGFPYGFDDTLEGIDLDEDGIRDDVQAFIETTYPGQDNELLRNALKSTAVSAQTLIQKGTSSDFSDHARYLDTQMCAILLFPDQDVDGVLGDLASETFDTYERIMSYFAANDAVPSSVYKTPKTVEEACTVDTLASSIEPLLTIDLMASSNSDPTCDPSPTKVTILFGNGITATRTDALRTKLNLETILKRELDQHSSPDFDINYDLSYNNTGGLGFDTVETLLLKVQEQLRIFVTPDASRGDAARVLLSLLDNATAPSYATPALMAELRIAVAQANSGPDVIRQSANAARNDADRLATEYSNYLNSDRQVLVVAHSQGNLFANAVVDRLRPFYGDRLRIVGVGTPTSYISGGNVYTTATNDLVIEGLRLAIPDILPPTGAINGGSLARLNHYFIDAYMNEGNYSYRRIINQIDAYIDTFNFFYGNNLASLTTQSTANQSSSQCPDPDPDPFNKPPVLLNLTAAELIETESITCDGTEVIPASFSGSVLTAIDRDNEIASIVVSGAFTGFATKEGDNWSLVVPETEFPEGEYSYTAVITYADGSGVTQEAPFTVTKVTEENEEDCDCENPDPYTGECIDEIPVISVGSPPILEAEVGQSASGSFSVGNVGGGILTFTASASSPFSVNGQGSLVEGETVSVDVSAACTEVGTTSGTISVSSNDPNSPKLSVDATLICKEPQVTVSANFDGVTLRSQKIITCNSSREKPVKAVGIGTATDPEGVVTGIALTGAFSGTSKGTSVSDSKEFGPGSHSFTATATAEGGKSYSDSSTFTVVEKVSGPPSRDECTESRNDPRITTFDGLGYGFQAVGEFISSQTDDGAFIVQARQSPVSQDVSVNSAVAVKTGEHRVAYYLDEVVPLWIDGEPTQLQQNTYIELEDETTIFRGKNDYTIVSPPLADDTHFSVDFSAHDNRIDMDGVGVPTSYRGRVTGIAGSNNGNLRDDIALRDNTVLEQPVPFEDLYNLFGESWRIAQEESLFDYRDTESTKTYTDRSYPSKPVDIGDFTEAQRAAAEATCRAAGVTDEFVLQGCIEDLLFTNDPTIASSAAGITPPQEPLEVDEPRYENRTVIVRGKVVNALVTELPLRSVEVTFSAPGKIVRDTCSVYTSKEGLFYCRATLVSGEAFTGELSVEGYGPRSTTSVEFLSADIPRIGGRAEFDLGVFTLNPATVRVTGIIQGKDTFPAAEAEVNISSYKTTTASDGSYELFVPVSVDALTGSLQLEVSYSTALENTLTSERISYDVTLGQLAEVEENITLAIDAVPDATPVGFSGKINAAGVTNNGFDNLRVRITGIGKSASLGTVCESDVGRLGSYGCDPRYLPRMDNLELEYVLDYGDWFELSRETFTASLTVAAGESETLRRDFTIAPRTLTANFDVADENGVSVRNAEIRLRARVNTSAMTDSSGRAQAVIFLPSNYDVASADLTYFVNLNSTTNKYSSPELTLSTLNTDNPDKVTVLTESQLPLTVQKRTVNLEGALSPAWDRFLSLDDYTLTALSENGQVLCTSVVPEKRSNYFCRFEVSSEEKINITLRVSGKYGVQDTPIEIPANAFNTKVSHYQGLRMNVSGVLFAGTVATSDGGPAQNAYVELLPAGLSTRTDSRGRYSFTYAFANSDATEEFTIRTLDNTRILKQETVTPVTFEPNKRLEIPISFAFTEKPVTLKGVLSVASSDSPLVETQVIFFKDDQQICDVLTDASGAYMCPAVALPAEAEFELGYQLPELSSSRETLNLTATIATQPINLKAGITTLSIKGFVKDDVGIPLSASELRLSGGVSESITIAQDGSYAFELPLSDDVGTFDVAFGITYGTAGLTSTTTKTYTLRPGQYLEVEEDLIFAERALSIGGRVVNTYAPELPLPGAGLVVTRSGETLCETTTDANGLFQCPDVSSSLTEPFSFEYRVSGFWGGGAQTASVAAEDLPALGERAEYQLELPANPTTLKVSGIVKNGEDADAVGVAGVIVSAEGISAVTNEDGSYALYLTFQRAVANLNVTVEASNGVNREDTSSTVNLIAGRLTELDANFILKDREPGTARWALQERTYDVVSDGITTYAATATGVVALDAQGAELWRFAANNARSLSLLPDGTLYVGASRKVYALSPEGVELWNVDTSTYVQELAQSEGILYAADGSYIRALSLDGSELWRSSAGNTIYSLAVAQDGTVYSGVRSRVRAFNPDGSRKWGFSVSYNPYSLALAQDGTLYVGSRYLYAINPDGTQRWRNTSVSYARLTVAPNGDILAAGSSVLKRFANDGTILWTTSTGVSATDAVLGNDGNTYIAVSNKLAAFGPEGAALWTLDVPNQGDALRMTGGTLLFGADALYAVNASGAPAESWSQPGRTATNQGAADYAVAERRTVSISGKVSNLFEPGSSLSNYRVEAREPDGRLLCSATSTTDGSYICAGQTEQLAAFPLNLTATYSNESASAMAEVAAGATATKTEATADLAVPLTTLFVSGTVTSADTGVLGATVDLDGSYINKTLTTDENGGFAAYFAFPRDITLDVTIEASDGVNTTRKVYPVTLNANSLNELSPALVLAGDTPGAAQWSQTLTGGTVSEIIALPDGSSYVSAASYVYKLDAEGQEVWRFRAYSTVYELALGADGTLYLGGNVYSYALNAQGQELWQVNASGRYLVVAPDGNLYFGQNYDIAKVAPSGVITWSAKVPYLYDLALAPDGTLIYTSNEGIGFQNADGSPRLLVTDIANPRKIAISSDAVYINGDRGVRKLNFEGETLWQFTDTSIFYTTSIVLGADGGVFAGGYYGEVIALDSAGQQLWRADAGPEVNRLLLGNDGALYVATDDGLVGYNSSDGTKLWQFVSGDAFALTARDGSLLLGADKLYAVNATLSGLAPTPWAMNARNLSQTAAADSDGNTRRSLTFAGSLTNPNGGPLLNNYTVSVTRQGGELLCRTQTDEAGAYACGVQTLDDTAFTAEFSASGTHGTLTGVNVAVPAGDANIAKDLSLPITTLVLRGNVSDGNAPINNATVYLRRGVSTTLRTDASGNYEASYLFTEDVADLTVDWTAFDTINERVATQSITLTKAGLTEVVKDFTLDPAVLGNAKWEATTYTVNAQALAHGQVYTGSRGSISRLRAHKLDGNLAWSFDSGRYNDVRTLSATATHLFMGNETKLYKFTPGGEQVWEYLTPGYVNAVIPNEDGGVYLASQGLRRLGTNGELIWELADAGEVLRLVQAKNGTLYALSNSEIKAVSPDGTLLWTQATSFVYGVAISPDDQLVVSTSRLVSAYANDGSVAWTLTTTANASEMIYAADGTLYLGLSNRVEAYAQNRSLSWTFTGYTVYSLIAAGDGNVYVGTSSRVYGLDAQGEELFAYPERANHMNLSAGTLYAGYSQLNAVNVGSSALAESSWAAPLSDNVNGGRRR